MAKTKDEKLQVFVKKIADETPIKRLQIFSNLTNANAELESQITSLKQKIEDNIVK